MGFYPQICVNHKRALSEICKLWVHFDTFRAFFYGITKLLIIKLSIGTPVITPYQHSNTEFNINARFIGNRHNLNHR